MKSIPFNKLNAISGGATAEQIDDCVTALNAASDEYSRGVYQGSGLLLTLAAKTCQPLTLDEYSEAHSRAYAHFMDLTYGC